MTSLRAWQAIQEQLESEMDIQTWRIRYFQALENLARVDRENATVRENSTCKEILIFEIL